MTKPSSFLFGIMVSRTAASPDPGLFPDRLHVIISYMENSISRVLLYSSNERPTPWAGGQWPPLRCALASKASASGGRPMAAPTVWSRVGGIRLGRAANGRPYGVLSHRRRLPRAGGQWPPLRCGPASEASASGGRPMAAPTVCSRIEGVCPGRAANGRPYDPDRR